MLLAKEWTGAREASVQYTRHECERTYLAEVPFPDDWQRSRELFMEIHEKHGIERVVHCHVPSVKAAKRVMALRTTSLRKDVLTC